MKKMVAIFKKISCHPCKCKDLLSTVEDSRFRGNDNKRGGNDNKRGWQNKLQTCMALVLFSSLLLAACSAYLKPNPGHPAMQEMQKTLQAGYANNQSVASKKVKTSIPNDVNEALLPPLKVEKSDPLAASGKRFDVSVKNVPVDTFLLGLVKDTSYNMVIHSSVAGSISLDLKNVSIEDVLNVLHDSYGYRFRTTNYGYEVLPPGLETRVFTINYLNVNRTGNSSITISSGQITEKVLGGGTASSGGGSSGRYREPTPGSNIQTASHSDFWTSLTATVTSIIGTEGGRHVIVNPLSGNVIVKAYPNELSEVAKYLDALQATLNRQVIIDAKILEVQLSDEFESGIDWKLLGLQQESASKTLSNPNSTSKIDTFANIFALSAHKGTNFSAIINLLSMQGNVQTLSSPRLTTLNNQKAVIKVGSDEFFITNISSTTTASTATSSTQNIDFTPFFSGVALDVTPEIGTNHEIILHIHPFISNVVDKVKTYTITSGTGVTVPQEVPLAFSTIRESDNIVRAEDGQIVVIGGLIGNATQENIGSTPGVDKIPVLGAAFRRTSQAGSKTELVILLRPTIVKKDTWTKQLRETAEQYRKLDQGYHLGSHPEVFGNMAEWEDSNSQQTNVQQTNVQPTHSYK